MGRNRRSDGAHGSGLGALTVLAVATLAPTPRLGIIRSPGFLRKGSVFSPFQGRFGGLVLLKGEFAGATGARGLSTSPRITQHISGLR